MKDKSSNKPVILKWAYCKRCKQYANHRISEDSKKLDCVYCGSLKNKKKWGVSKSKPKGGWTKLKFGLRN